MFKFKPFSVQQKMTGIIFLVSMIVMVLTSLLFIFFELKRMQDFAREDLGSLAKVIATNSGMSMTLKDHVAMQKIVDSLGARHDVAVAYLLNLDGHVIVKHSSPEISDRLTEGQKLGFLALESRQIQEGITTEKDELFWKEEGRFSHLAPVYYDKTLVGYGFLSFETSGLLKQKLLLLLSCLLAMGVAALITYLLSRRLQKHITDPVESLAEQMKRISIEKRLVLSKPHDDLDEFGFLFEGFDEMIKALKERDQQLEKHRQELEMEVQVRTRALETEKERAEQATLAKSKFLANMSHEIRTPMIGVLGMADLLRQSEMSPENLDLAETIYKSGEALLGILNDVLDFSKIEAGRLEFSPEPVDIKQITADVVQLMKVNAYSKGLLIDESLPDSMPLVVADPGRVRQILLNLIGNAIKFTSTGSVAILLQVDEKLNGNNCKCQFRIKDTGPGISEKYQESIFESFEQGSPKVNLTQGGTGLGLSIVKELVDKMGGTIVLDSTPGLGSEFTIMLSFPWADETMAKPTVIDVGMVENDSEHARPGEYKQRFHILLAEDNQTTQHLVSILMKQMGYSLSVVDNGRAAVDFLERQKVDLVLMDCHMPVLDGFRASQKLREVGEDVPIIALTAYARAEDEEECRAAGMNDFLSKPFRQAEIRDILTKWLPQNASHDQLENSTM